MSNAKQQFLSAYDREHATTMRVLRAYPDDQLDFKPHPRSNSARDLAWLFVMERGLGTKVWHDEFAKGVPAGGGPPKPPEQWADLLNALEQSHLAFRELVSSATDDQLAENVHFFVAPKTMGAISRLEWIWFLLHDQIHHRGQFSVYLRMVGGKVPSIYGPSADEPWI
jgi:uncharacterized damage-inducible protein DinB